MLSVKCLGLSAGHKVFKIEFLVMNAECWVLSVESLLFIVEC